jgi:hypothetical protein
MSHYHVYIFKSLVIEEIKKVENRENLDSFFRGTTS